MTNPVPVFALTTHGLEGISATELAQQPDLREISTAYRRVMAVCEAGLHALLALRTVDDVYIRLADWDGLARERATLARFTMLSADLDLKRWLHPLLNVRPVPRTPVFSVTVSFVGARNYTTPDIKTAVSAGVMRRYPHWHYSEDDEAADLNLRVFIEHEVALVGLRIGQHPLHRRPYKLAHLPGSLKPSVAAALLRLAAVDTGMTLLDPFCGVGTLLAEASVAGTYALGGDQNSQAVQAAQINTSGTALVLRWDARALPLAAHSVDAVVSNPPWGRQIAPDNDLHDLYTRAFAEIRRVTRCGGQIVLLTGLPDLLPSSPDHTFAISLFGQRPLVACWTVR